MGARILSSAVVLLLGGCFQAPEADPNAGETLTSSSPGLVAIPEALRLTGCASWSANVATVDGLGGPSPRPEGWGSSTTPGFTYQLSGWRCEWASVGPFERGPIHLLFDGHSNADVPLDCTKDNVGTTSLLVLSSIWTEDAELAAWLAQTYGLPVYVSEFGDVDNGSAPLLVHEWSWGVGRETSRIAVIDDGTHLGTSRLAERFFWQPSEGGISWLEISTDGKKSQGDRMAYGEAKPPMLLASRPNEGTFVADSADWYSTADADARIRRYSDMNCENRLAE